MADAKRRPRPALATLIASGVVCVGVVAVTLSPATTVVKPLAAVLTFSAVIAELLAAQYSAQLKVSAAFVAAMIAVGFLGPLAAFLIPTISFVATWLVERYRWRALIINIASSSTPVALTAVAFQAIDPDRAGAGFALLLAAAAAVTMALNFLIAPLLFAILDGTSLTAGLRSMKGLVAPVAINIAVVATIAEIYAELGLVALVFVLLNVVAFTYMARLVVTARERTREYASLSWGVLSGLIRTLDERDSRAARHCAAVAAFSRDIANQVGLSKREQELRAHRGPPARHRQVRPLRPGDGARRRAAGPRLARCPPPPGHRRRAAAGHRGLRARWRRSCAPTTSGSTGAGTHAA